jgi:hypothetical protein
MSLSRLLPFTASRNVRAICAASFLLLLSLAFLSFRHQPRIWPAQQTPLTFWAWRNQTPSDEEVRAAIDQSGARALFLRAGQIDLQNGKPLRIRPVTGRLPRHLDLHLVYNATPALLASLEQVVETALADVIAAAYAADSARATRDQARVVGLQIDIDMPTRLLRRYEKILAAVRSQLTPGAKFSITGLPTWMESADLRSTLTQVDFWIPQLYGTEIPSRSDQFIPISSVRWVSRFVNQVRQLDKPFYAGLAAYSYTLLYNSSGALVSVRGDIDPATVSADPNLQLIDQRPFDAAASDAAGTLITSEWRYAYKALADTVIDGLSLRTGELLIVDIPTAESLRASSRAVRELAGEKLLGICVFRLPLVEDPATLTIAQVITALADREAKAGVEVNIYADNSDEQAAPNEWILEVKNSGTASSANGKTIVDLQVPSGALQNLAPEIASAIETLCDTANNVNAVDRQTCSQRRANVIRFKPRGLRVGQTVRARLEINFGLQTTVPIVVRMQTDTGEQYESRFQVAIEKRKHER